MIKKLYKSFFGGLFLGFLINGILTIAYSARVESMSIDDIFIFLFVSVISYFFMYCGTVMKDSFSENERDYLFRAVIFTVATLIIVQYLINIVADPSDPSDLLWMGFPAGIIIASFIDLIPFLSSLKSTGEK